MDKTCLAEKRDEIINRRILITKQSESNKEIKQMKANKKEKI